MEIWGTLFSCTCPCGDCWCLRVLGVLFRLVQLFFSACISISVLLPLCVGEGGGMGSLGGWGWPPQLPAASPHPSAYTAASLRSQDRIIFRPWRCIWLVRLDFISWLPFPALRFLPLGLYLRYREPHQPVQHQRNTSATCCTHLHPPEGAPVCGGRDQHQRSKCHRCHCCHRHTQGRAKQHTPAAPAWTTAQLLLVLFYSSYFAPSQQRARKLWGGDTFLVFQLWQGGILCTAYLLFCGVSATPANKSRVYRFLQQTRKSACAYSLVFSRS